jgi:hypothetical protein
VNVRLKAGGLPAVVLIVLIPLLDVSAIALDQYLNFRPVPVNSKLPFVNTPLAVNTKLPFVNTPLPARATPKPIHLQGIPNDWSHHHLIFSRPSSPEMARRLEQNPRYRIQQAWRARQVRYPTTESWMQNLDALAIRLAAKRTLPRLPRLPWGKPFPSRSMHGDWSMDMGSSATVGADRYPAKFSFNGSPNCTSDFVVFNTSQAGSSPPGQASIIAYNNLYEGSTSNGGCGTSGVPTVDWAYDTGGPITNSVVLSGDGTQIAFIKQNNPANLVILRPIAGEGSTSVTSAPSPDDVYSYASGNTGGAASYLSCKTTNPTKSCQLTMTFINNETDTDSSPFYDYANDIIYVGDDFGYIHQFTNVFKGTPAETGVSSGTPWRQVSSDAMLTSPVIDSGTSSQVLYFGEYKTGYLDYIPISATFAPGSPVRSGQLGFNTNEDIADGPIVDSSAGKIYVAVSNDTATGGNGGVFVFSRSFTSGSKGAEATIGTGTTGSIAVYDGDFDNAYYSTGTGNLYICGNPGGEATLYQVPLPISSPTPEAGNAGPVVSSAGKCSPVTEVYNSTATGGPFDWIFLSVASGGNAVIASGGQACTGACVYSYNVVSGSIGTKASNGLGATGGSSGIVIDNTSTSAGASQIYYSNLGSTLCTTSGGSGGCAIQASQSGLLQPTPTPTPTPTP